MSSSIPTHIMEEHARRLGAFLLSGRDVLVPDPCVHCGLEPKCDLAPLQAETIIDQIVNHRTDRWALAGTTLFRAGDSPANLYVSRSGMCKSVMVNSEGRQIIPRFFGPGELMGLDGLANGVHQSDAVTLKHTQICTIRHHHLQDVIKHNTLAAAALHRILSTEILREMDLLMILTHMNAEERLAAFLLDFRNRCGSNESASATLTLPMSRQDIGIHLGMRIETVSRVLSRLQRRGFIAVHGRQVTILLPDQLHNMTLD